MPQVTWTHGELFMACKVCIDLRPHGELFVAHDVGEDQAVGCSMGMGMHGLGMGCNSDVHDLDPGCEPVMN